MIPVRTITLVLSIVCLVASAWADYKAGMDAYSHGDYATALREWRPLAEQGNAAVQYNRGLLYHNGMGVPQDYVHARQWYEKAAVQGHANAQLLLGALYEDGKACRRILSRPTCGSIFPQRTEKSREPNCVMLSPDE
jgi:TPR repeat protein